MNHESVYIDEMLWVPGQGPDESRVLELARIFGKPREPLGEAWFMGETRRMYDDLNEGGIEAVPNENLDKYLKELPTAIWCFPHSVHQWEAWYAYLTPRVLISGRFLGDEPPPVDIGYLWDGLIALSWVTAHNSPENRALAHETDFASVLVPLIMHPQFWPEGHYKPVQKTVNVMGWDRSLKCRLPTSLLLAWRYLPPESLRAWLRSVLAIDDDIWRGPFMMWLQQIEPIFTHGSSAYKVLKECDIKKMWPGSSMWLISMKEPDWESIPSHSIADMRASIAQKQSWELIPPRNIAALREAIVQEFDEATCEDWMEELSARYPKWAQRELVNLPQVLALLRS